MMLLRACGRDGDGDGSPDVGQPDPPVRFERTAPAAMTPLLVARLARRWRQARDCGLPAQPPMHALLGPMGLGILVPVLDGLFTASEVALDRPLATGCGARLSADEQCLTVLLLRSDWPCRAPSSALRQAVVSARLMQRKVAIERWFDVDQTS
jgi:hypothetical protein